MLIRKKKIADSGCREAFQAWWEYAQKDLISWDVGAFFLLLQAGRPLGVPGIGNSSHTGCPIASPRETGARLLRTLGCRSS
jgi:hypothetical protein